MRIGIIGGGSIGLLFAYYLSKTHEITIYTRSTEQAKEICQNGIFLEKNQMHNVQRKINAVPFSKWHLSDELTIVTVKQYQLMDVIDHLAKVDMQGHTLLFLQNGMGHLKSLALFSNTNIFVGTVEHGANRTSLNSVRHNGVGLTRLAVMQGEETLLTHLVADSTPDFPLVVEQSYKDMLLKKLVVNAVINPLTAILRVRNGELIDNCYFYRLVCRLFDEIKAALSLEDPQTYFQNVEQVCRKTADNRSSMLKDVEEYRQTEIDAILGYILDEAKEKEIEVPLVQTFYDLIKGSELLREA